MHFWFPCSWISKMLVATSEPLDTRKARQRKRERKERERGIGPGTGPLRLRCLSPRRFKQRERVTALLSSSPGSRETEVTSTRPPLLSERVLDTQNVTVETP